MGQNDLTDYGGKASSSGVYRAIASNNSSRAFLLIWRILIGFICTLCIGIQIWMFTEIRDMPTVLSRYATTSYVDIKCRDCNAKSVEDDIVIKDALYRMTEEIDKKLIALGITYEKLDAKITDNYKCQDAKMNDIIWRINKIKDYDR